MASEGSDWLKKGWEPPMLYLNTKISAYKINSVIKKKKYFANPFYKNKNSEI